MNVSKQVAAYGSTQQSGETIRETEARALLSCAGKLEGARQKVGDYELYLDALSHNQQLWTIFQTALVEPENPLPRDLKITLLTLSKFVDKQTLRAKAEYNPELLTSLIDINKQIAAGLATKQETAPEK